MVAEQFLKGSELHNPMLWGTEGVRDKCHLPGLGQPPQAYRQALMAKD